MTFSIRRKMIVAHSVRRLSAGALLLCGLVALAVVSACQAKRSARVGGQADANPSPTTSARLLDECAPCHGAGVVVAEAWDAASVYPDLMGSPPFSRAHERGWTKVVPVDTTLSEWQAAQTLLVAGDSSFGKDCAACHGIHGTGEPRARVGRPPLTTRGSEDLSERHRTFSTPNTAIDDTYGIWVHGRTYQTLLVATVKVLNYGAGHRAPSGEGASVELRVTATDSRGNALDFVRGERSPALGSVAGGAAGTLYVRTYRRSDGSESTSPSGAVAVARDTRLQAGEHDALQFTFALPRSAQDGQPAWKVEAELVYRPSGSAEQGKVIERADTSSP